MTCARCCGLMVETHMLDMEGAYGEMWASSRRCVNCGHVYDVVSEQNRRAQQQNVLVAAGGEPDAQNDDVLLGVASLIGQAA